MKMIEWICFGTVVLLMIALVIGVKVTISAKNAKIDALNTKLEEVTKRADSNRLAYDLVVENHKANEKVEEVLNECKETVEKEATDGDNREWYSEPLPDGVRDIFIECVCALDDSGDTALRDPACAGNEDE